MEVTSRRVEKLERILKELMESMPCRQACSRKNFALGWTWP